MRSVLSRAALFALAFVLAACSSADVVTPEAVAPAAGPRFAVTSAMPTVRISEIHYDNDGLDAGERVEVSAPAGTDLTGWTLVLYNGSGGGTYGSLTLPTGVSATVCGVRQVVVATATGLQNGSPDGLALVNASGAVVEFLSYEGAFVAANGPAVGLTSVDIGVSEPSNTPVGRSLQRNPTGTWIAPAENTFGICNDGTTAGPVVGPIFTVVVAPTTASTPIGGTRTFTVAAKDEAGLTVTNPSITWSSSAPLVASVDATTGLATALDVGTTTITATAANGVFGTATLTVTEAVSLPSVRISEIHYDNFGDDVGEAIEIEAPAGTDLSGWQLLLYNGNGGALYNSRALSGVVASTCSGRGVLYFEYPQNGIQNGSPDGVALVNPQGAVVEFLSYEGAFTATDGAAVGIRSVDILARQDGPAVGLSLQRSLANTWALTAENFGGCNGRTPASVRIKFSGRDATDPALPVGFQHQIFATASQGGVTLSTPLVWSSDTPNIASVDQRGVITSLSAGTAVFRATTADGTGTGTYTLQMAVAVAGTTADYGNHTEFGLPTDADASDDFIITRPEYTVSFSKWRNTPNWASYNLEATHRGDFDRCDCFTYDPALPADYPRYNTADYTGVADVQGYGIDRGHLVRSADRTTGSLDNARTFYFSNIIPQASDNNQGPWAVFETYLGTQATSGNKEVFIVTGVAGNIGTVKNEGKIVIPASVWKVAVILPRNQGLANVITLSSAEVIAVIMPNVPGIRSVDWNTYRTTVDAVEALSGYDVLSLLRDDLETAIESNTKPPVAAVNGPFNSIEDESVAMSASASTDPDNDALTYAWSFGDGATATGVTTAHVYATSGTFTVRLIATDIRGLADTVTTTATVLSPAQALDATTIMVDALAGTGRVNKGVLNSLNAKLNAASNSIRRGNETAAMNQLEALLNQLDALVRSRRITEVQVAPIRTMLNRVIRSLSIS